MVVICVAHVKPFEPGRKLRPSHDASWVKNKNRMANAYENGMQLTKVIASKIP